MCVASMIGDHFGEKFKQTPYVLPYLQQPPPPPPSYNILMEQISGPPVSRNEFLALKATVDEMVALLKRAKIYDEKNGEPECEIEEKMVLLRQVAKLVGVDLDKEVLGHAKD